MNPDAAREQAREILSQRRFSGAEPPRPFERPLRWLGDRLDGVFTALDRALPGGGWVVWLLLAALVVLAALMLSRRSIRGRAADGTRRVIPISEDRVDARELERQAAEAARAGDHETAVRLHFRAGLARLVDAEVLEPRSGMTTGDVAARLRSDAFDALGADFDAIVYGGRPADVADAAAAERGWRDVLASAR